MRHSKLSLLLFIFSIFFTPLCCSAAESEDFQMQNEDFKEAVLPLSFAHGLPTVGVKIGDQLFNLVLDTGADQATIELKPNALSRIKVKYLEGAKNSLDVYGNAYQSRSFVIPELQIGTLHLTNLIAGEELRSFVPVDGIIGNGFLKHFYVLIDFPKAKAILYPKKEYPARLRLDRWRRISFEHNSIGIIVTVKIDDFERELKFSLDSGSGSSAKKKCGLLRANNLESLTRNIGGIVNYDHVSIGGIDLGQVAFAVVDFKEPPVDGFFGDYFFNRFKTFIDFDRKILFVKE